MAFLKLLAAGALGYAAYRALQAHHAKQQAAAPDSGERTPPHGDPVLVGTTIEVPDTPASSGAQFSRSFGEP
jgi:uncharacterized membrane protein YebE (DUF533 family)